MEGFVMGPLPSSAPAESSGLRIGEVARRSGLSVKTIRFYCDQGVLRPAGRSEGGYRLFATESLKELALIRALRTMDLSIADVAGILEVRRTGVCNCSTLKQRIGVKMAAIDARIQELEVMRNELKTLISNWQDCGGVAAESSD
jgi:DNA-binding transcriptional MerR regulator